MLHFFADWRSVIAKILIAVGVAAYIGMGVVQIAAVLSFFQDYWGWGLIPGVLAAIFIGLLPIVGSVMGLIAAITIWEWPFLWSLLLFSFPLVIWLPVGILIGFGTLWSKLPGQDSLIGEGNRLNT
jgi:hypothetical protein